MKIAQFYDKNQKIRLGLFTLNGILPIEFDGDMKDFISEGAAVKLSTEETLSLDQVRFAPPVMSPSKIIAIGLNYRDHAEESKGQIPEFPLVFAKFPSSLIGHNQSIIWDRTLTNKVDFEAELAVIIGKDVRSCPEGEALDAVFGYTCANDVSARDLQFTDTQWVRGKSLDTFCPLGPWIVTAEELPNPHALRVRCLLNDNVMQDSNTASMIFGVPRLVSFLSRHFTLQQGDVILTGTPHGVGAFRSPSAQ